MKKLLIGSGALIIAITFLACARKTYTVTGKVDGVEGTVYMTVYGAASGDERTDSVHVSAGNFRFRTRITEPSFAVVFDRNLRISELLILDSRSITVGRETDSTVIYGSPLCSIKKEASRHLMEDYGIFDPFEDPAELDSAVSAWKEVLAGIVEQNGGNLVGVLLLSGNSFYLTPDETLRFAGLLSDEMQQTVPITKLVETARSRKNAQEGNPFTDITLPCTDGKPVSLSEFAGRGNFVLLDFWASWCGPCLSQFPELRELYRMYHRLGFQIFAVSLDVNSNSWKEAIESHDLPWVHVGSMEGWECSAARSYGVNSIPRTFLIDPEGTIVRSETSPKEIAGYLAAAYADQDTDLRE